MLSPLYPRYIDQGADEDEEDTGLQAAYDSQLQLPADQPVSEVADQQPSP